jgi:hypothetical protein
MLKTKDEPGQRTQKVTRKWREKRRNADSLSGLIRVISKFARKTNRNEAEKRTGEGMRRYYFFGRAHHFASGVSRAAANFQMSRPRVIRARQSGELTMETVLAAPRVVARPLSSDQQKSFPFTGDRGIFSTPVGWNDGIRHESKEGHETDWFFWQNRNGTFHRNNAQRFNSSSRPS